MLALLLVAVGLIAPRLSLQSPRPAEGDRLKPAAAPSVPSRLWEDPIAAVELGRDASGSTDETNRDAATSASLSIIQSEIAAALVEDAKNAKNNPPDSERLLILPVMLAATPFRDDAEERRRVRYAVVSGLLARGFVPRDAEHIKFATWCPDAGGDCPSGCVRPSTPSCAWHKPVRVPYEVFGEEERDADGDGVAKAVKPGASRIALVLWLGEGDIQKQPLVSLRQLFEKVSPPPTAARMAVVGPLTSDLYVQLLSALDPRRPIPASLNKIGDIRFYSYGATISSDAAKVEAFGDDKEAQGNPPSIVRVIGEDRELVKELVDELALRHVNRHALATHDAKGACNDEVVLLVEEDSTYGRNLGRELKNSIDDKCRESPVHVFNYFRGVDGQLPTVSGKDAKAEPSASPSDRKHDEGEHAAGRSQYDYLQRLVDSVAELNTEGGTKRHVRAVGIFGNDVYDKLLILEAMRSRIRDAIYFTTDLDARFLHYDQRSWTRNLIVASHFGLTLDRDSQGSAPAFRSVYQTAAFLATKLAVDGDPKVTTEDVKKKRGDPHRFEIGRTRAVDLTARKRADCRESPNDCPSFHPPPVPEFFWPSAPHAVAISVLGVLVVLLTTRTNRQIAQRHRPQVGHNRRERLLKWLMLAAGALAVAAIVRGVGTYIAHESALGIGEPFVLLQGVSVWLSLFVRFLALVVALVLAAVGLARLRKRAGEIAHALGLSTMADVRAARGRRASDNPQSQRVEARRHRIDWLRGPFVDFTRTERTEAGSDGPYRVSVNRLWRRYLGRTAGVGFWSWIALATALFTAFAHALNKLHRSFFPHRGHAVALLNRVLMDANVVVLWATIFWIVFEALACAQLLNRLAKTPSSWPAHTLKKRSKKDGVPEVLLVEALDFELIVRAAERVNFIVYLPFVQIVLLGFALHPIFGNADLPLPLVVIAIVSLIYVAYAMIVLRRAAERAKRAALEHYRADLLWLEGGQDDAEPSGYAETCVEGDRPHQAPLALDQLHSATRDAAPAQIRGLMEGIETTRKGPFLPLLQQPFVKALLLPFGGLGGASLVEPLLNYLGL
jgi:hypothetical protein